LIRRDRIPSLEIKHMEQAGAVITRRNVLSCATAVGAVAAATRLPGAVAPAPVAAAVPATPANARGYRLTDHIRQYYATTLV
jgi:hypothetical protein